jgi:tRNA (pseudouridine54-N1)-methyltransferase
MREFIYFSRRAVTTGNFGGDLAQAGRMDIAIHTVIHSFFISRARRKDVRLHLFFYGPPNPPMHLEINSHENNETTSISKKDISGLIKKLLYKYKKGTRNEAVPGCFVEKKDMMVFVEELVEQGRDVFILDEKGEDIRTVEIGEAPVFILGDHEGFPKKEFKRLKKSVRTVAVGKTEYFASQVLAIVQNEIDRREEARGALAVEAAPELDEEPEE